MEEIIKPFEKSLFDNSLIEIGTDMIEVGIDSLLEDGLLKDVPIVGNIFKAGKVIYNLYDRNLLKQTLIFIQEFNKGTINYEKLNKYRNSIEEDSKKAEKELGRVLIILNKIIDSEKSTILAKLYLAYINENIAWKDFCELSEANDRLFVSDIGILFQIYDSNGEYDERENKYILQRLISIGLIKNDARFAENSVLFGSEDGSGISKTIKLTQLGNTFCNLCR